MGFLAMVSIFMMEPSVAGSYIPCSKTTAGRREEVTIFLNLPVPLKLCHAGKSEVVSILMKEILIRFVVWSLVKAR